MEPINDSIKKLQGLVKVESLQGFCIDLIKELAKDMKFKYNIILTKGYGSQVKKGRWDGMVGQLVEKVGFGRYLPPYVQLTLNVTKDISTTYNVFLSSCVILESWYSACSNHNNRWTRRSNGFQQTLLGLQHEPDLEKTWWSTNLIFCFSETIHWDSVVINRGCGKFKVFENLKYVPFSTKFILFIYYCILFLLQSNWTVHIKGTVSPIIPNALKCFNRHFTFHRKYVCFE